MKRFIVWIAVVVCAVAAVNAQQSKKGVSADYAQFALSVFTASNPSAAQGAMFLGGHIEKGKKEQFGLMLGTASTPVIELLDAGNKVLGSMTAADLLGKGNTGVKLLHASVDELGTVSDATYAIKLPQGQCEFAIHAIATGGTQGAKPKVVITMSLTGSAGDVAALRISMPVEGQAQAFDGGFTVASKTQAPAFSTAVFPKPKSVTVEKNGLTIVVSKPAGSSGKSEAPLLWMIAEGSSSANAALTSLKANAQFTADPNLVIVTTANKLNTQPADTVTYTLVCTNIGLGNATAVVLSNPIPAGTSYVEDSATGSGTEITMDREQAAAPQRGAVKVVRWKLTEPLVPGAEKIVKFKVVIR